jgi:hypothetical protein
VEAQAAGFDEHQETGRPNTLTYDVSGQALVLETTVASESTGRGGSSSWWGSEPSLFR